jgi:RNA polymerase sigma-70 factor (ECF subfamily)
MNGNRSERDCNRFNELEAALVMHGNRFFRFAYSLCGSREDAEDIVEEAFLAACQNHDKVRDTEALVGWLYRIVLNRYRMHRRRRRLPVQPLSEADDVGMHMSTDRIALLQAMEKLSPKQREALVLVKGEGLTLKEAAGLLGRPIGTVASHVTQAMTLLKGELFPDARTIGAEVGPVARWNHELP